MFARARSSAGAVIMAVLFVFGGCSSPTDPPVTDLCPGVPGVQTSLPCEVPVYKLTITIDEPKIGTTVARGQSLICKASVKEENAPAGSTLTTVWRIDGKIVDCQMVSTDKGPELVSGPASPATTGLSLGSHTVSVEYCNSANGECRLASSEVVVIAPPDQILFRLVEATYPNAGCVDIWGADAVPGATPRRLTTGCNKGTFAVTRDGKTLWYTELGTDKLWKSNIDGSNPVLVPTVWNGQSVTNITNLRVSPDGSKISFLIIASDGDTRVLVMNADGTGLRSLVDRVPFTYTIGGGSAWMPDSRHLMVVRDSSGTIDGTFRTVQNQYVMLDLETGEEKTVYVSKYGEDQYNSILRQISDTGDQSLHWEIQTTGRATIVRTDGSGEIRSLTERDKNAAYPIFCGERVCFSPGPQTVFGVDLNGQNQEEMIAVANGWIIDLAFVSGS